MEKALNLKKLKFVNMDLQADIKWIVSEVTKVKDPELITAFKSLLRYRAKQNNENLDDELPVQVQKSIKRGIEQARKGEMKLNSEVKKKYEKWL